MQLAQAAGGKVTSAAATSLLSAICTIPGFTQYRIPLWLRRLVTMVPAFFVVALGIDATRALVLSQVALSLILPVPMIALLILTRRRGVMGSYANGRLTKAAATAAAAVVLALNLLLVM
jgi:manganese transport protein